MPRPKPNEPVPLTDAPQTDPAFVYTLRDELYAADMFIAALVGLDLFTWLDARAATPDEIARHFGLQRRPVDVMTTLLVAMELLERDGEALRLSDTAREHLVAASPWFLRPYFPKLSDRPIAQDLLNVLRTGMPAAYAGRQGEADWHHAMESDAFAEEFISAMDVRGRLLGQALARKVDLRDRRRLLDIGGGSGIYACSLAAHFPELHAAVLEKPPVDRIAARGIERYGVSARVGVITGDMLVEALPSGYDVHLFSNVLHDWDEPVVQRLLNASAGALETGGLLIIHDAFLNSDKSGPRSVAAYSVLLLHGTQGRCYSTAELGAWLDTAGFDTPHVVPLELGRSAMIARRR